MERKSSQPLELFYCYARKDRALRDELDIHLAGLRRSGLITSWYDGEILPGIPWGQAIKEHLEHAHIILLLVSPDFIHSDYCYSTEMTLAIERHHKKEAIVIPILLRPGDWVNTPFSILQMLPSNALPITRWPDRDEAFADVVHGIRRTVLDFLSQAIGTPHPPAQKMVPQFQPNGPREAQKTRISHSLQSLHQANGPDITRQKSGQELSKRDKNIDAHRTYNPGLAQKEITPQKQPSADIHLSSQIHIPRWKQVLRFTFICIEILLLLRLIFRLLGANTYNSFISFLYGLSHVFVGPFNGIFNDQTIGNTGVFEVSTLIAMAFYGLIFWMISRWLGISILGHKR